jgi:hypothetical protein
MGDSVLRLRLMRKAFRHSRLHCDDWSKSSEMLLAERPSRQHVFPRYHDTTLRCLRKAHLHRLSTMLAPNSSYSCLLIHI